MHLEALSLTSQRYRAVRIVDQTVHQRHHIAVRQRFQRIAVQIERCQRQHTGEHTALQYLQFVTAQVETAQIVEAIECSVGESLK